MRVKVLFKNILFNILIIIYYNLALTFNFMDKFDLFGENLFFEKLFSLFIVLHLLCYVSLMKMYAKLIWYIFNIFKN